MHISLLSTLLWLTPSHRLRGAVRVAGENSLPVNHICSNTDAALLLRGKRGEWIPGCHTGRINNQTWPVETCLLRALMEGQHKTSDSERGMDSALGL